MDHARPTTAPDAHQYPDTWRRPPLFRSPWVKWVVVVCVLAYVVAAVARVEIDIERITTMGVERAWRLLTGFFPPDFFSRWDQIVGGVIESLGMTVVSTFLGVLISIPVGFGAARNLVPLPVYLVSRAIVMISRTFQEVIIAIVFVAMFGLGAFAGILTLTFATIGFFAKLLAEEIEACPTQQINALRATGASWPQVWWWAVVPRVTPRIVGLSLYRLDINFRESTVIGIVGAGGIGVILNTSLDRFEYDIAAAVLLTIIAIVFGMELLSTWLRKKYS